MTETPEEAIAVMRQASEVVSRVLPSALADLVYDELLGNIDAVLHGSTPQLQWVAREVLALAEQRQARPDEDAAVAEAFNTAHEMITVVSPQANGKRRHEDHMYHHACYVCRGDVGVLSRLAVDALAAEGLLRTAPESSVPARGDVYVYLNPEALSDKAVCFGDVVQVDQDGSGPVGVEVLGAVKVTINGRTVLPAPEPSGDVVETVAALIDPQVWQAREEDQHTLGSQWHFAERRHGSLEAAARVAAAMPWQGVTREQDGERP